MQLLNLASAAGLKGYFTDDLENLPADVPVFLLMPTGSESVKRIENQARTVVISGCGGKLWIRPPHSGNTAAGLEYLYNLGHRKIGFFYHTPEKIINPHLFAYYKFMAERGVKVYDHWLLEYGNNSDMAEKFRAALRHTVRPDSVLVPACWLPTVYEVLRQEKLLIPWHISVLSIGHPPEDFQGEPYPAVLADNPVKLADRAWKVMFSDLTSYQEELAVEITNTSSIIRR
jgi:DNA-binding LacI/PurR family transcriptional regulator